MYQLDSILVKASSLGELANLCSSTTETAVANEAEQTIEFYNNEGEFIASFPAYPVEVDALIS